MVIPWDASFSLQTTLEGPWNAWSCLVASLNAETPFEEMTKPSALKGELRSQCTRLNIPHLQGLDRPWKLQTAFLLFQDRTLKISDFQLNSDFLELLVQGTLNADLSVRKANVSFSFPQLSLLRPDVSFPIYGAISGKGQVDAKSASFAFASQNLKINRQFFAVLEGQLNAAKEREELARILRISC